MHERLKDLPRLIAYFENLVENEAKLFAQLVEAREKDKLEHFMTWSSISFHETVVFAGEARRYLDYLNEKAEGADGEVITDERKHEIVKEEALRQVLGVRTGQTTGNGSLSHRISETARDDFFINLFKRVNDGY